MKHIPKLTSGSQTRVYAGAASDETFVDCFGAPQDNKWVVHIFGRPTATADSLAEAMFKLGWAMASNEHQR